MCTTIILIDKYFVKPFCFIVMKWFHGKTRNYLSPKIFRQINSLDRNLFGETITFTKFLLKITGIFSHFLTKISWKQLLYWKITKQQLISRNIFSVRVNFLVFHSANYGKTTNSLPRKSFFVELKTFSRTLIWRNFCKKTMDDGTFCNFQRVSLAALKFEFVTFPINFT